MSIILHRRLRIAQTPQTLHQVNYQAKEPTLLPEACQPPEPSRHHPRTTAQLRGKTFLHHNRRSFLLLLLIYLTPGLLLCQLRNPSLRQGAEKARTTQTIQISLSEHCKTSITLHHIDRAHRDHCGLEVPILRGVLPLLLATPKAQQIYLGFHQEPKLLVILPLQALACSLPRFLRRGSGQTILTRVVPPHQCFTPPTKNRQRSMSSPFSLP